MRDLKRVLIKAVPALVVGMAFFVYGCQSGPVIERTHREEPPMPPAGKTMAKAEGAFQAGDYTRALAAFQQVLAQTPDHPRAAFIRYQIAYCLFQTGYFPETLDESLDWLGRYPGHPLTGQTFFLIARTYQALKDPFPAFEWFVRASRQFDASHIRRQEIDKAIMDLIKEADFEQIERMARQAVGTEYAPQIYYRITSRLIEENRLHEAQKAAMDLVRSTSEQYWVSLGRQLLGRIERDLSPQKGVIGCLLPLTGSYAIYGQETLNGIQLGMDMFNSSGTGADLELVIRDTAGDVNRTLADMKELAAEYNLMAIIGPLAGQTVTAAAEKAGDLDIPIIILTQKEGLADEGGMVFRNFLTPRKEVGELVDRAVDEMGLKRFGILYPDNSYGRYFMNLFWDRLNEKGGTVKAVESYPPDETDFGNQIKKMVGLYYPRPESIARLLEKMKQEQASLVYEVPPDRSGKAEDMEGKEKVGEKDEEPEPFIDFDAVFIPDNYNEVALIAPQFPFYRVFNMQLLGTSLWHSQELIDNAGDYVQGAVFPSGFYNDQDSEPVQQFMKDYRAGFDSEPGLLAATGYDTIRLLKKIFEDYKIMDRKDVQASLNLMKDFQGVTGKISFNEQGEVEKKPVLLTISGNKIVKINENSLIR